MVRRRPSLRVLTAPTVPQRHSEAPCSLVELWYSTSLLTTRRRDDAGEGRLPDLLTVEEAARLIRVGRTKAYAMAQEWRATGGRTGLPVVDFGHVLRVPRRALEQLIGTELTGLVHRESLPVEVSEPPIRIMPSTV